MDGGFVITGSKTDLKLIISQLNSGIEGNEDSDGMIAIYVRTLKNLEREKIKSWEE